MQRQPWPRSSARLRPSTAKALPAYFDSQGIARGVLGEPLPVWPGASLYDCWLWHFVWQSPEKCEIYSVRLQRWWRAGRFRQQKERAKAALQKVLDASPLNALD